MSEETYAMVTVISTHRMRYAVPVSELQKLNPTVPVNAVEWAMDLVTEERVSEFSQKWLGEQIVDAEVLTEDEVLKLFDKDNDYLKDWTLEKKLSHIRKWEDEMVM